MITGSHNPPDYNGFKMMLGHKPFFTAPTSATLACSQPAGNWESGAGGSEHVDIMDRYVDRLVQGYDVKPFNIARDCGNGVAGPVVERLVKRLPGKHITMFTDADGNFPNHHRPDRRSQSRRPQARRRRQRPRLRAGVRRRR